MFDFDVIAHNTDRPMEISYTQGNRLLNHKISLTFPPLPAHDNRPRRIPRPPNLILIPLHPNQPPAAPARRNRRNQHAHHHAAEPAPPRPGARRIGLAHHHAHAPAGPEDQQRREDDVLPETAVLHVAPEHGEQTKHLDAEERQAKHLLGRGQAAGQHGRRHEGCVGGQRGGELGAHAARVVEKEDVDGEEPEGHGPDAVLRGGLRQGFEYGTEAEEGGVDQYS